MLVKKIFVYGSLRSDMFNYKIYLDGNVESSHKGYISGDLSHLDNKGYPAVVPGKGRVLGELMNLIDFEKTLSELDKMENYEENGTDNEYNRKVVEVELLDATKEKAYYYEYNPGAEINKDDILICVNHGDWKEFMLNK